MKKLLTASLATAVFMTAGVVFAQEVTSADESAPPQPQVTFPIPELGNCESKESCRAYCADASHQDACLAYAETHGLMKKDEAQRARKFMSIKSKGPGGCTSATECRAYCEVEANRQECFDFAKKNGLLDEREQKIAETLESKGGPGGCKSEQECRTYCSQEANFEECKKFAEEHGLRAPRDGREMSDIERPDGPPAQLRGKINDILSTKTGPGGCTDVDSCKTYCTDSTHAEECITFAKENGLMTKDEAERAQKFAGKPGPGGCKSEECRTYCADESHTEECVAFAEKNGFMKSEDAQRARTFMQMTGPGGCKGEECKTYCEDSAHAEECRQFAMQNGFMQREGRGQFEGGSDMRMGPPQGVPGMMQGPGGCKNREECEAFCKENPDQCREIGQRPEMIDAQQIQGMPQRPYPQGMREEGSEIPPQRRPQGNFDQSQSDDMRPRVMVEPSENMPQRPQGAMPLRQGAPAGEYERNFGQPGTRPDMPQGMRPEGVRPPMNIPAQRPGNGMMDPTQRPDTDAQQSGPTSMTPLSMFTASVFAIFQELLK